MAYNIVWEFEVSPARRAEFEAAYGPHGDWACLFRQAQGFVAVTFLRSTEQAGHYLTIDRWASQPAFENFRTRFAADYKALDERLAALTTKETRLGAFETVR